MSREDIIEQLWLAAEPNLYISKEEFVRSTNGWEIETAEFEGELAFVCLVQGPLFHFHSLGTKRPVTMSIFRPFLQKIIDQHGYAETRTPRDDERQHRFNRLVGFIEVGEDEFDTLFRIERFRRG